MKQKCMRLLFGIALAFAAVGAAVLLVPSPVSFGVKNHLSMKESQAAYISPPISKAIGACKGKEEQAAWLFLSEKFHSQTQLNDICQAGGQTYIDITQTVSGEPVHMIYQVSDDGVQKYIDSTAAVTLNNGNRTLASFAKTFETIAIPAGEALPYADPFAAQAAELLQKNKKPGLQEHICLQEQNRQVTLTVYETVQPLEITGVLAKAYPAGTPLPLLAMANKTTVSVALSWLGQDAFDTNGALKDDTRLCVQKQVLFRYGRQVGVLPDGEGQERTVINQWEAGTALFSLQQPFAVNFEEDCVSYEITQRPAAMSLCDAYFKDKGLQAYYQQIGNMA